MGSKRNRPVGCHRAIECRSVHVMDMENLLGGNVTAERSARVWAEYRQAVGVGRDDLVIVGVAERNVLAATAGLPASVRWVFGDNGKDGADHALTSSLDPAHAIGRFDRLVIASGDGHFAPLALRFRIAGRIVTQVAGEGFTSTALYLAVTNTVQLPGHRPHRKPAPAHLVRTDAA